MKKTDAAKELLSRRRAREGLLDFTTYTKKNYQVNWHHELACRKIDELISGKTKRLIISMPPRHGKSELVSRRVPAYALGLNPDTRIIATSYSANLASRMNRDAQRIIESKEYRVLFPDTQLASGSKEAQDHSTQNASMFEVVGHEGAYISAGVRGSITGSGFDIGIIDDPFKNREEAESETIRARVWEWYTDTFYTRQEENAAILMTMTRWHEDDLVGRVLNLAKNDPDADQWEVVVLPALSEETRAPYDRRDGPEQALWEGKYSEATLKKTRATVPVYTWLSLYQQRPSAAKGNLFKRKSFQYFTESPGTYDLHTKEGIVQVPQQSCIVFQTCDPAGTAKTSSDYFVLSTWALTPINELLLLDVFRTQIEGPDHMEYITKNYHRWHPSAIGFESVSIGKTTYQNIRRAGLPVIDLKPEGDKFSRALSAAIRLNTKTTYFRAGAAWLTTWEDELLHFPKVKHDDQVDTLSYADYLVANDLIIPQDLEPPSWGAGFGVEEAGSRI